MGVCYVGEEVGVFGWFGCGCCIGCMGDVCGGDE